MKEERTVIYIIAAENLPNTEADAENRRPIGTDSRRWRDRGQGRRRSQARLPLPAVREKALEFINRGEEVEPQEGEVRSVGQWKDARGSEGKQR